MRYEFLNPFENVKGPQDELVISFIVYSLTRLVAANE